MADELWLVSKEGRGRGWLDYRGLRPGPREREEPRAGAAAEDDWRHRVRADVPPRRRRRRLGARVRMLHLKNVNTIRKMWPARPLPLPPRTRHAARRGVAPWPS
jgi:hypothetical protein